MLIFKVGNVLKTNNLRNVYLTVSLNIATVTWSLCLHAYELQ